MQIKIQDLEDSTVRRLVDMRSIIDMNPPYQRDGDIWSEKRKAKLIDTIINSLDIPKIYLKYVESRPAGNAGTPTLYEVVDGKQRLGAIYSFIDSELRLDSDFIFFEDRDREFPKRATAQTLRENGDYDILSRILNYKLSVEVISTQSGDMVEELFLRLNESSSLNAAEKRNAISGETKDASTRLADHSFWIEKSPIKGARFKYREMSSRFLAIEEQMERNGRISDVKAATLLRLFQATSSGSQRPANVTPIASETMRQYETRVTRALDLMVEVFLDSDTLLSSIGTVTVYYIVMRDWSELPISNLRELLQEFENLRRSLPPDDAEEEIDDYKKRLPFPSFYDRIRHYQRHVQSSGDGQALTDRAQVLKEYLEHCTGKPIATSASARSLGGVSELE